MMTNFLQVIMPLLLVLGLIAGAAWLLQRLTKRNSNHPTLLTIQAAISVGPRERVVLLEVAGQWLVLGVAPGQVSTLLTLPSPPVTSTNTTQATPIATPLELAQSWLERYRKPAK
jgi:flagellar protein FliO/FliZ